MPQFPFSGLIAVLLASAATMAAAAAIGAPWLSGASALAAAAGTVAWTLASFREPSSPKSGAAVRRADAVRFGAIGAALVYAWGGCAMLGVYLLSGLSWEHGWQYGAAMTLIAAGILAYARWIAAEASAAARPRRLRHAFWLTALHGLAAAGALVFLVASGKLWAGKSDWAANQVFLAGGLALMAICIRSAIKQAALAGVREINPRENQ